MSDSHDSTSAPPAFSIPDFGPVDATFGASERHYLTRGQLGDWYGMYGENSDTPYHKAIERIFFQGGSLEQYGLKWKNSVDQKKAMTALRALMCSWAPKHEIKIGTCAVLLANHCDLIEKAPAP